MMSKNRDDTMTGEEHLKQFGFQYAHEFIRVAESNIAEIIVIEKHLIAVDHLPKILAKACDIDKKYIKEQLNENRITRDTLCKLLPKGSYERAQKYIEEQFKESNINPNLIGFSQYELSQVQMPKRYLAFHCIAMAFEMLYKTAIANENTDFERKHPISILHNQLGTSKEEVEGIIIDHGWESVEDFTSYFDEYFSDPSMKYFESYLVFDGEEYKHPNQLIRLFHKIGESMRKTANQNKDRRSGKWTHPIRLLSR